MIAKSLVLPRGVFSFNYEQSVVVLFAVVVVGFLLWFFLPLSVMSIKRRSSRDLMIFVFVSTGPTENSHLSSSKLTCPSI